MVTPLDSAGNEGISTTFEIVFDNSAAALTATQVVTYISLLDTVAPVEVLTGAISDDTGVAVLEATLQDPEGLIQITDLPIVGESWSYSTLPTIAGTYQIWLIAVDEVGNAADLGPYLVQVNEPSVSLAVWPNENVTLGGVVTYTLAITNPNPFNAVTAAITDPLPVLLGNPVVVNGSATIVGEAIQWNPAVSPQSTVTTSFTAVVTQGHAYFDVEAINSAAFSIDTFSGTITGMVKASFGTQGETLIFVQDTVYSRLARKYASSCQTRRAAAWPSRPSHKQVGPPGATMTMMATSTCCSPALYLIPSALSIAMRAAPLSEKRLWTAA